MGETLGVSVHIEAINTQRGEEKSKQRTDTALHVFVFIEFLQYISLHLHILPTSVAFFVHVELNWNKLKGLIYFKQLIKIAK